VSGGLSSFAAILLIAVSSWTLGGLALFRHAWRELRGYERLALRLTAGLGLTALVLSLGAVAGLLAHAIRIIVVIAAVGGVFAVRQKFRRLRPAADADAQTPLWARVLCVAVVASAAMGCIGAVAPVTDDDALRGRDGRRVDRSGACDVAAVAGSAPGVGASTRR
jgi:hypothetical protein